MKTLSTLILTFVFILYAFAKANAQETCDCSKDLAFMNRQIREMTSFKKQIKGDRLLAYNDVYEALKSKAIPETPVLDCYKILNTLLGQVKDKHAHIRHNIGNKFVPINEASSGESFRESEAFKNHPKTSLDLVSMRERLSKEPEDSLEGIYYYGDEMRVGIVATQVGYDVIVLESNDSTWSPGQLHAQITPAGNDKYNVLVYRAPRGKMSYLPSLYYADSTLWSYRKNKKRSVSLVLNPDSDWEFKQLTDNTQYVYFGSWSNRKENIASFKKFYETHKNSFTAENIIVDLRNNGGGNSKYSDPFYKIFKKEKMNVYVITNFWSGSNTELFTIKLKKLKNTLHLGQRTYGAIAYGSNYGKLLESPSGKFSIYPTDMSQHKLLDYEYTGIQPDIKLDFDRDWIEQTLEIIRSKS